MVELRWLFCSCVDLSNNTPEKATCIKLGKWIIEFAELEKQNFKYLLVIKVGCFGTIRTDVRRVIWGMIPPNNLESPFEKGSDCWKRRPSCTDENLEDFRLPLRCCRGLHSSGKLSCVRWCANVPGAGGQLACKATLGVKYGNWIIIIIIIIITRYSLFWIYVWMKLTQVYLYWRVFWWIF